MNQVGRKIYYEKSSGNVILTTSEMAGSVVASTVEEDFKLYTVLSERVPETVGVLMLSYGQFAQDFAECIDYRVNVETKELVFIYPVEGEEPAEPVYKEPLSVEIENLKARTSANEDMLLALMMGGM